MAKKKNSVAPAAVASTARRPPPARVLAAENSAQHLRSQNIRLVLEAVELRKQLHLLTSKIASTDTGRRVNEGIRRNRAALSSRLATIAAVTTVNPATPIAAEQEEAEQEQSTKPGSELASISTGGCTVDPFEQESFVLSSDVVSTPAICAADNAPVDPNLSVEPEDAAEKTFTWVEVAAAPYTAELLEQSKQVGSELASIHADRCCDVAVHSCDMPLTSAGCADDLPLVEEEPEDHAEEEDAAEKAMAELIITEQGNQNGINGYELASVSAQAAEANHSEEKNKFAEVNQVEEKKKRQRGYSKWWICPAGILVAGITLAIFCKKSK